MWRYSRSQFPPLLALHSRQQADAEKEYVQTTAKICQYSQRLRKQAEATWQAKRGRFLPLGGRKGEGSWAHNFLRGKIWPPRNLETGVSVSHDDGSSVHVRKGTASLGKSIPPWQEKPCRAPNITPPCNTGLTGLKCRLPARFKHYRVSHRQLPKTKIIKQFNFLFKHCRYSSFTWQCIMCCRGRRRKIVWAPEGAAWPHKEGRKAGAVGPWQSWQCLQGVETRQWAHH